MVNTTKKKSHESSLPLPVEKNRQKFLIQVDTGIKGNHSEPASEKKNDGQIERERDKEKMDDKKKKKKEENKNKMLENLLTAQLNRNGTRSCPSDGAGSQKYIQ